MSHPIQTATVIGAGTMGAAIAAHLANAGLTVHLLDIAPTSLSEEERTAGAALSDRAVRNRIVQAGFDRMAAARPANLFSPSVAERIHLGNLDDDLAEAVRASDWIIEAIVERLAPKQALMARLEPLVADHAVVSTNTSGLPIHQICAGCSPAFRRRFLGIHFFNPPRYLPLLEIIPTGETDPAVVAQMRAFGEEVLGKGVVICKDTPNFIANRMVSYILADVIDYAVTHDYTVEEVDALTGPLLGRPRSGTFRLNDIVGIDVWAQIADNLHELIPDDPDRDVLLAPAYRQVMQTLIDAGHLGVKSGQGFYKTVVADDGSKAFWGLDLQAARRGEIAYLPPAAPTWESVDKARRLPLAQRIAALMAAEDRAGQLIRHTLTHTFAYAAQRIPEIADTPLAIDQALTWGYGWEMGPFALWDALGVAQTVEQMRSSGARIAPWVSALLTQGNAHFYHSTDQRVAEPNEVYAPAAQRYVPIDVDARALSVETLRRNTPLAHNDTATLHDMGDGVLLLEFHTKANALNLDLFPVLDAALDRLHGDAAGLVIGNDGVHFSAGADLRAMLQAAEAEDWAAIDRLIRTGQAGFMALRAAPKPVVAAPFQRVLGGGAEICYAAHHVVAHAETAIGLVELGVGLIPGWGGCKEMVRRHVDPADPLPGLRHIFDLITSGRVSGSALEAVELGLLPASTQIVMNRRHLLHQARQAVLDRRDTHTPPTTSATTYAAGPRGHAALSEQIEAARAAGRWQAHDFVLADALARVLTGGDAPGLQDEQHFLDLEHEAFLRLIRTPATQARIRHMLSTGKPLRN